MSMTDMQKILEEALVMGKEYTRQGECASYIPELGRADKHRLGICVYTREQKKFSAGDTKTRFTLQSISKVISLAMALEHCGFEKVFEKMNMEPSGDAFNSLIKLDLADNKPFNPMINAGAIATVGYLVSEINFEEMLEYTRRVCLDQEITLDQRVFDSEMSHCSRNRAIAYLLQSKGILENDVEESLEQYTRMCSLSVTAESLAGFGMVLAGGGLHPTTGQRLMDKSAVQVVKTIMLTCGMYDGSGEFAVRVGLPSKSGVGGGILSVAKQRMGIGIYGPALDEKGNSIAGRHMLEYLSQKLKLHLFAED
ncbi:MAG: glutaminase A [Lachnospiraceae bacterium]|jgi:glutaminase|nr:glutaminase A [Lachnospiraceae bacterium]